MFRRIKADIVDYFLTLNGFDVFDFVECIAGQTGNQAC